MAPNDLKILLSFREMKVNKKYKEQKMKEIVMNCCAVINSRGGRVTLVLESDTASDVQNLKRSIEQSLSDVLGYFKMRDINHISSRPGEMVLNVENVSCLCTMNYNMCIPTETQVLAVPAKTSTSDIKEVLLSEKRIVEVKDLVMLGTHQKEFVFEQPFMSDQPLVHESRTVQFKYLKAEKSKCVSLGDRITNNGNKFTSYVSAFANHSGGHIYYGVDDDGVVKGECVKDRSEVIKKVSKAINKMVWPAMEDKGPVRGQHWDIFFERVNDVNGCAIPSVFVIVVHVARCTGGVFTEEPESYHIVHGEVMKMEFSEWKERLFQTSVIQNVPRIHSTRSSEETKNYFYLVMEKLCHFRNNGKKKDFERYIGQIKRQYPNSTAVLLAIYWQEAAFAFRKTDFMKAEMSIKQYEELISGIHATNESENILLFQSLGLHLHVLSAKKRFDGNYEKCHSLTTSGLQNLELVSPGLCSAWFYLHFASLMAILARSPEASQEDRSYKIMLAKTYNARALEHTSHVVGFSKSVVDIQQKVYIYLASLYLGCCMNGTVDVRAVIIYDDIRPARNCLLMVSKLIHEGYPLSALRHIQYLLVQSSLMLRQSQLATSASSSTPFQTMQRRTSQLQSSLRFSEDALKIAIECHLDEMIGYSRQQKACITEEIVRASVRNIKPRKKPEQGEDG